MTTPNSNIGLSNPELVVSAQEGSGAPTWPRVRNLPAEEREPFGLWLNFHALPRPIIEDESDIEDQDGYWHRRLPVMEAAVSIVPCPIETTHSQGGHKWSHHK